MLSKLLPELDLKTDIPVTGVTDDSRKVRQGDLFLAVAGSESDGRKFISEVADKSAAAILCDPPYEKEDVRGVPIFPVENLAFLRGEIAKEFYDDPSASMTIVAVTGTNGKTSCSQFIASAMSELGRACGVIGTMGSGFGATLQNPGLTTPDAITLQKIMAELRAQNAEAVSLEASSHGLDQGRLNGLQVNVGVFTNLTRDHLDYHQTLEAYRQAKQKLFQWPGLDAAVINLDDDFGQQLGLAVSLGVEILTYSLSISSASLWCRSLEFSLRGFKAAVATPWGDVHIDSPLLGDFNVSNLLAVVAVLGQQGFEVERISNCVSLLGNIKGRMDVIYREGAATVVVDYAHTPDALEKALKAVRLHTRSGTHQQEKSEIWCVMGCGGNRDKGKRPLMGEIAARLADHIVITDDNPRDEDSLLIINDIMQGIHAAAHVVVQSDRKKAIAYSLQHAQPDDVVLIAGKGHEEYQEISGNRVAFSDYEEVARHTQSAKDRDNEKT
ncbi:MAG: UDP-N-acetylmuramoyl-L-alanyl-D-glutamate--2,6-diaminopimelate ligase [bacterium]|nr:UDP-N-acetylmuramoyl-L-alanyl-D-glutamate--2,6-diaminopimelate ligase [Gammaproteobacteria bacterium]HIL98812.1 UDP-N-acetylmuramoyl-L-alanyl-D-glutamate--2,6-diaminopimelate ligase [Pseudomonadales bacterium]